MCNCLFYFSDWFSKGLLSPWNMSNEDWNFSFVCLGNIRAKKSLHLKNNSDTGSKAFWQKEKLLKMSYISFYQIVFKDFIVVLLFSQTRCPVIVRKWPIDQWMRNRGFILSGNFHITLKASIYKNSFLKELKTLCHRSSTADWSAIGKEFTLFHKHTFWPLFSW